MNVRVFASYIKSKRNKDADFEFRKITENTWTLLYIYLHQEQKKKFINTIHFMSRQTLLELILFHTARKWIFLCIPPIFYYSKSSQENFKRTGRRDNNFSSPHQGSLIFETIKELRTCKWSTYTFNNYESIIFPLV